MIGTFLVVAVACRTCVVQCTDWDSVVHEGPVVAGHAPAAAVGRLAAVFAEACAVSEKAVKESQSSSEDPAHSTPQRRLRRAASDSSLPSMLTMQRFVRGLNWSGVCRHVLLGAECPYGEACRYQRFGE